MNAITPANETPWSKRRAASGMLPIDPMNVKNAASGPTSVWSSTSRKLRLSDPAPTKSVWKNDDGTNAAMMPATVKPNVTSFHTIFHSIA